MWPGPEFSSTLCFSGSSQPGLWQVHSAPGPHPGAGGSLRSTLGSGTDSFGSRGSGAGLFTGSHSQLPSLGAPRSHDGSGRLGAAANLHSSGDLQNLSGLWDNDSLGLLAGGGASGAAAGNSSTGGSGGGGGSDSAGGMYNPFNPFAGRRA